MIKTWFGINYDLFIAHYLFPVAIEQFCPRNNYVGKYSSLSLLNQFYIELLCGWKEYLLTKKTIFFSDFLEKHDANKLRKKIKYIMSKL